MRTRLQNAFKQSVNNSSPPYVPKLQVLTLYSHRVPLAGSGACANMTCIVRTLCANMTETSCVIAISEQGGKEIQHGKDEWFCAACDISDGDFGFSIGCY